jgi:hypothetical protein
MSDGFHLLDLPSQALAVQRLLAGRTAEEKLAWLAAHGTVERIEFANPIFPPTYRFTSSIGMECVFFLSGDQIVFLGDNTTFTGGEYEDLDGRGRQ